MKLIKNELSSKTFRRILSSYVIVLLIPVVVLTIEMFFRDIEAMNQKHTTDLERIAEISVNNIDNQFVLLNTLGNIISGSRWINVAVSKTVDITPMDKTNLLRQLSLYSAINNFSKNFALFLTDKDIVVASGALWGADDYLNFIGIKDENEKRLMLDRIKDAKGFSLLNNSAIDPEFIQSVDFILPSRAVLYISLDMEKVRHYTENYIYHNIYEIKIINEDSSISIFRSSRLPSKDLYIQEIQSRHFPWYYRISLSIPNAVSVYNQILPLVLLVLLVSALALTAAYFATRSSYKPIRRLISKINLDRDKLIKENTELSRMFAERETTDDMDITQVGRYYYPTNWENQLVYHLKTRNQVLSQRILLEIQTENSARKLPRHMEKRVITMLFETLLRVIEEMKIDINVASIPHDMLKPDKRWDALKMIIDNICDNIDETEDDYIGALIIRYVQEHYNDASLSLKQIGEQFNLSVSSVSRIFKAEANLNYINYVTSIRMEKAKEYLENDSLTIKEIAAYVGYDNEASFKRAFMRYKGITPTKYKNENKNYVT